MKLLLDTHIFLWFISGDERLPKSIKTQILSSENEVYLSVISIWEAIVKHQIGKLVLPQPAEQYLPTQRERHQIESLDLDEASISHLAKLPLIHRDPFDRILICQCIEHGLTLVTVDNVMREYEVSILRI